MLVNILNGYHSFTNEYVNRIGAFTSIGPNIIMVPNDHRMDLATTSPILSLEQFPFCKSDIMYEWVPKTERGRLKLEMMYGLELM